jgi:1-acyl-sn-glycerol-3-phosphate acyltransferase
VTTACTAACAADRTPTVPPAQVRRRWWRLTLALAGAGLVSLRAPLAGSAGRRHMVVGAAARVLTAAGVRVEVHSSPVAWPPTGRGRGAGHLVVSNWVSWVDELALLTVVPGVPVADREVWGWPARRAHSVLLDRARPRSLPGTVDQVGSLLGTGTSVTVRPEVRTSCGVELGRFRPAFFQAAVDTAAPVCPVAVRYRVDGGLTSTAAASLTGEPRWRSVARVVAARGLVVEVHLLPALDPVGADRRELAALAEYTIAAVTEARPTVGRAHPQLRPQESVTAVREQDRTRQPLGPRRFRTRPESRSGEHAVPRPGPQPGAP